jgi:AcrR family transcriptional regulator
MARQRPDDGWERLMAAALRVYARLGSRLGIRDVAREMGVSPATVYGYVTGKRALLFWMTCHALTDKAEPPGSLPADAPAREQADLRIGALLETTLQAPELDAVLREPGPDARAELERVLEELYEGTERTAELVSGVILDVQRDPAGAGAFFGGFRHRFLDQLRSYIELRVADGSFAPVPSSEAAAHLVVQVAAWFARDRQGDPEGSRIPADLARATATRMLARALLSRPPA